MWIRDIIQSVERIEESTKSCFIPIFISQTSERNEWKFKHKETIEL